MTDEREPVPAWLPPDYDDAPVCADCGHSVLQHLRDPEPFSTRRIQCLFEGDKPPDERCKAFRTYKQVQLW